MLNINKEGMKELHVLSEGLSYPVAVTVYTDWHGTQLKYLLDSIRAEGLDSYVFVNGASHINLSTAWSIP